MGQHPLQPKSDKPAQNQGISLSLNVEGTSNVELRPQVFSYRAIKDAKRRVLQNLSGSGEATVVEIVTYTALPFDLASAVISDLETEGKVTVKIDEGLKWVELKK
jgi:predicted methyltransferase